SNLSSPPESGAVAAGRSTRRCRRRDGVIGHRRRLAGDITDELAVEAAVPVEVSGLGGDADRRDDVAVRCANRRTDATQPLDRLLAIVGDAGGADPLDLTQELVGVDDRVSG